MVVSLRRNCELGYCKCAIRIGDKLPRRIFFFRKQVKKVGRSVSDGSSNSTIAGEV